MSKKREIHPAAAREGALKWLEISLEDEDGLEEFWDNYQELLEEPAEQAAFLALAPQVFAALKASQPAPVMSREQHKVFKEYLERFERTIATSELANTEEDLRDAWTAAVLEAWIALCQPLRVAE